MEPSLRVVLIIGAPGVGKSLLGKEIETSSPETVRFFSVGNQLREMGKLEEDADGRIKSDELSRDAKELLESEIEYTIAEPLSVSILVLECVKCVDDAYTLMDIIRAQEGKVTLVQVLYISDTNSARVLCKRAGYSRRESMLRDMDRLIELRQEKWLRNLRGIIELFSSTGVMAEVSSEGKMPTLAKLGYARTDSKASPTTISPPKGLLFTPLQPVVSRRMITDRSAVKHALHEAEMVSGLRMFISDSRIPVPSRPIITEADAQWVSWPGRYCVSCKCDGTRYLLIVGKEDGVARMQTRTGSLYEYPVETRLHNGTILDGELMWIGRRGFFVAFDVISVGGGDERHFRAWQLPLLERMSALKQTHPWIEEVDECVALRQAMEENQRKTANSMTAYQAWQLAEDNWNKFINEQSQMELDERKRKELNIRGRRNTYTKNILTLKHDEWEKTDDYFQWRKATLTKYLKEGKHHLPEMFLLEKKQQAPYKSDAITIVWKQHLDVSEEALRNLTTQIPYPSDGLVFTPKDAPYKLGMAELMYKWQSDTMMAGDIITPQDDFKIPMQNTEPMTLLDGLVYECKLKSVTHSRVWDNQYQSSGLRTLDRWSFGWNPESIRWDKTTGNDEKTLERMQTMIDRGHLPTYNQLVAAVKHTQEKYVDLPSRETKMPATHCVHPAKTLSDNGSLYSKIMEAVAKGEVEHTVDKHTGLHIFNHLPLHGNPATDVQSMCRGLVCNESKMVVAMPFTRFTDKLTCESEQLWQQLARASFKVDGSLAIAFLWDGELQVSTRRRMDSQQAVWAREWLRKNAHLEAFEKGWTYLFEAVFNDNTVVVQYQFDAAVLLSAISPDGTRASHEECAIMAARMGVMLVPSVVGTLEELEWWMGRQDCMQWKCQPSYPPRLPAYEGWIITTQNGVNTKFILPEYKQASFEAARLHPLEVWDRVRTGGECRTEMLHCAGLSKHHSKELAKMLDTLQTAYSKVRKTVAAAFIINLNETKQDDEPDYTTSPPLLAIAIDAARKIGDPGPASMHYEVNCDMTYGHMRALLLDCVRPSDNGTLVGYIPSPGITNTIAKGWTNGVSSGRMSAQVPLINAKLNDPSVLGLVLEQMDEFDDMLNVMLVCKEWSSAIRSTPGFEERMEWAKLCNCYVVHSNNSSGRSSPAYGRYRDWSPAYSGYGSG